MRALDDKRGIGVASTARVRGPERTIIEALPIPAVITRLSDGTILCANDLYAEIFGVDIDDVVGRNASDLYQAPDQRQTMLDTLHKQGRLENFELELKRAGGSTIWAVASARLLDFEGEAAIFGSLYDMTEQKRAQDALRQSERRLQDFSDAGSDWFWETDSEHRFSAVTAGGESPPTFDPSQLIGKTRQQVAGAEAVAADPELWRAYQADVEARRPFRHLKYKVIIDDGRYAWVRVSGVPVFDDSRIFVGYRGSSTNITAQVEAEERATAAQRRLAAAIDGLSAWVAMFDADDRLVLANKAWWAAHKTVGVEPQIGEAHQDYLRRLFRAGVLPQTRGREEEWLKQRLEERRKGSPHEIRTKEGGWLLVADTPLPDGGLISTYTNITKLKRAEQAQSLLQSALVAANQAPDFGQALRACLDAVCDHTGWPVGHAVLFDENASEPVAADHLWRAAGGDRFAAFQRATEAVGVASRDDLTRQILATDESVWIQDVGAESENGRAAAARDCGLGAGCAFAVRYDGRVAAIVEFFNDEKAQPQEQLLEIFGHLGDQLGNVLDRRRADENLRQAQKMEAVGQLTGGLAHDFNNLLAVILGNLELIEDGSFGPDQIEPALRRAVSAAERGADLTARLLAFSRQHPLRPEATDVNRLILGFVELLQRTLGEQLWIRTGLKKDLWAAEIDRGQLEAALLNLAINARDAMPLGGRLLIETENVEIGGKEGLRLADLEPGRYVSLSVSDTGYGISESDIDKVFEPFFTTKESGAGSGLGLSMVYGFAKQSRGHVEIKSKPGLGTRVRLYLPATDKLVRPSGDPPGDAPRGTGETVLIVEDDADVRALVQRILTDTGYRTIAVDNADDGLALVGGDEAIDLLLTDIVLPEGMGGLDLVNRARARQPSIKAVVMSGYSDHFSSGGTESSHGVPLIAKPFHKSDLARIVRRILDETERSD